MVPELEKPRITEIQLRMDCNGCVQKIRKALRGVDGVYDISIDFAQQKLTVIGRAELDKILRAIKKTRKIAIICSHIDPNAPPPEQPSEPQAPPPPPPPPEAEPTPPSPPNPEESPQPPPPPVPPQETQPAEVKPSDGAMVVNSVEPKVTEEVHMVHHYPYSYVNNTQNEVPRYVYHWPYSDTLVGYKCPARKSQYWTEPYDEEYYRWRRGGDGGRIGTVFSEENPNNCSIM